ncbi:hypothetical protein L1987_07987 [Smallanthus sonchifolius]|uniref:Uncharacterized protein n=1 Tax=Smallanthus sonchifolius TaxID=185202 RepID=A0ACB9JJH5_9ASTR|nr:hypothetical protein L1987_07987 [Smallanthus sonchifolius]
MLTVVRTQLAKNVVTTFCDEQKQAGRVESRGITRETWHQEWSKPLDIQTFEHENSDNIIQKRRDYHEPERSSTNLMLLGPTELTFKPQKTLLMQVYDGGVNMQQGVSSEDYGMIGLRYGSSNFTWRYGYTIFMVREMMYRRKNDGKGDEGDDVKNENLS